MRGRQRRRRVAACLAGWIVFAAAVPATGGASAGRTGAGEAAIRTAASAGERAGLGVPLAGDAADSLSCEETIDCGPGCTAQLQVGFCSLAIKWKARIEIGPFQLGPEVEITCDICDCWYTYESPWGTTLFKRVSSAGCGGSLEGVEIHTV